MSHNKFSPKEPAEETSPNERNNEPSSSEEDAAAELFYKRLEQTGELVDVDESTDLASLPPHVTHIRRPDGKIERIGFS